MLCVFFLTARFFVRNESSLMFSNIVTGFTVLREYFLKDIAADLFTDVFFARSDFVRLILFVTTSHFLG
jgi:hypothetical protein